MDSDLSKWNGHTQVNVMKAYDAYYTFFITFEKACASEDYLFWEKMKRVIDKLYNPIMIRMSWWQIAPDYEVIDVIFIDELDVNLKRVQLLERLRVIRLFTFRAVSQDTFIVRNDVRVSQNRWVYEQILKVLPADRVMVLWKDREGLPKIPRDYRWLHPMENPPYYSSFWTNRKLLEGENFVWRISELNSGDVNFLSNKDI